MASGAAKVTLGIVGGVVALIVLGAVGLVAWIQLRPVLTGDYRHTYGYIETVTDLNDYPLDAMVATVGQPETADETPEHYGNRVQNTLGEIDIVVEEVDAALDSRAASKDSRLDGLLSTVKSSYADLRTTVQSAEDASSRADLAEQLTTDLDSVHAAVDDAATYLQERGNISG